MWAVGNRAKPIEPRTNNSNGNWPEAVEISAGFRVPLSIMRLRDVATYHKIAEFRMAYGGVGTRTPWRITGMQILGE